MAPLLFAALAVFLTPIAAVAADELRVAVPALPVSLDPQKALTPIERALTREIFEGLVTYDADGRLVPGLAESWIVESGGTGYVFKLRAGLRWSDGRRLEAEDIVDGLKRALDPATRAPLSGALLPIKNAGTFQLGTLEANQALGIVARGDRIEISLEAPSARLLHMLASSLAMPVPRHKLSALGDAWAAPFLVVANGALVPTPAGDGFALKRNPNYAGPAPAAAETVTFVAVHSRDAAIDAVQREAADVALGFDAEPAMGRAGAALRVDAGLATYHWIVNMTRRPFDDRNVRHALAMALDRDGLIDELKLDGARAGFSLVPKGAVAGYEPLIASYGKLQQPERDVIAEVLLLDVDRATAPPIVLAVPDGALHAALAARARDVWSRLGFAVEIVTRPAADRGRRAGGRLFDRGAGRRRTWRRSVAVTVSLLAGGRRAQPRAVWRSGVRGRSHSGRRRHQSRVPHEWPPRRRRRAGRGSGRLAPVRLHPAPAGGRPHHGLAAKSQRRTPYQVFVRKKRSDL